MCEVGLTIGTFFYCYAGGVVIAFNVFFVPRAMQPHVYNIFCVSGAIGNVFGPTGNVFKLVSKGCHSFIKSVMAKGYFLSGHIMAVLFSSLRNNVVHF